MIVLIDLVVKLNALSILISAIRCLLVWYTVDPDARCDCSIRVVCCLNA